MSSARCHAASPSRTDSGRSRATNSLARGLFSRSLATHSSYESYEGARHATSRGCVEGVLDSRLRHREPHVDGVEHAPSRPAACRCTSEAGEGEPMLMLHGWPQHWYEWRHLVPTLSRRYRVICPDLRGLGWTDASCRVREENLASDVLALLDALRLERVKLVGHDWGGWVGFLMCLREPERIERYLALNILPPFVPIDPRRPLPVEALVPVGDRGARARGGDGATGGDNPVFRWVGAGPRVERRRAREPRPAPRARAARATVQYYRSFQVREIPPLMRGRYRRQRPEPRPGSCSAPTTTRWTRARSTRRGATPTTCASSSCRASATSSPTSARTSCSTGRCRSSARSHNGGSSSLRRTRSMCIATATERSRTSARLPGSTGSRASVRPSACLAQKHT